MEYLKIDPIEELLKAIEIVHGKHCAVVLRLIVYKHLFERPKEGPTNDT